MRKLIFQSTLLVLIISNYCLSQSNQIEINYSRPPLNSLKADDMWNFTLKNNSTQDLEFYLFGTLTEENAGLIANGTTIPISLKKGGTRKIRISDLPKTPDINYVHSDQKYKNALIHTGVLPSGDYTICVTAKESGTNEELGNECLEQKVRGVDTPQLISPRDEEELINPNPIFTWMHMKPAGTNQTYTLKIVELKGDESPENAMLKNKAFFEKQGISQQLLQYPTSAPKFEKGKKYAWQVTSGHVESEVISFMIISSGEEITLSLTPLQAGTCCFEVNVNNSDYAMFNAFRMTLPTNTIQSANPVNSTVNPTIPPFINSILWIANNGFPTGTNSYGTVCFGDVPGEFDVNIQWSTNGGVTFRGEDNLQISCPSVQTGFCPGNILQNGNFVNGTSNWIYATSSPDFVTTLGCSDNGYISMWGNESVGESIAQQNLNIVAGRIYKISFCGRWRDNNNPNNSFVKFRFRASNGPIGWSDGTLIGNSQNINSQNWATYTIADWTATSNFNTILINPANNSSVSAGEYVSWGEIDNICITETEAPPSCGPVGFEMPIVIFLGLTLLRYKKRK